MATHSSALAWKVPWTEEPGGLQSMGSLNVRHDWATSLSLFTFLHWRRKWQPTPVFLPGESQGRGRLVGCRLWGRTRLKRLNSMKSREWYNTSKETLIQPYNSIYNLRHSTLWFTFNPLLRVPRNIATYWLGNGQNPGD